MTVTFEVVKLTECSVCAEPVIFCGPRSLERGRRFCSIICDRIDDARSPGRWIDASVLIGDGLEDRPDQSEAQ